MPIKNPSLSQTPSDRSSLSLANQSPLPSQDSLFIQVYTYHQKAPSIVGMPTLTQSPLHLILQLFISLYVSFLMRITLLINLGIKKLVLREEIVEFTFLGKFFVLKKMNRKRKLMKKLTILDFLVKKFKIEPYVLENSTIFDNKLQEISLSSPVTLDYHSLYILPTYKNQATFFHYNFLQTLVKVHHIFFLFLFKVLKLFRVGGLFQYNQNMRVSLLWSILPIT